MKKVNNLGESDITTGRRLNQEFEFVKENIEVMKDEELTEYSDTTYYANGTFSIGLTHTSHQRLDRILILHRNKEFNYSVRHSFTKNELNFENRQFQFFEMMKKSSNKWDRRITVK